MKNPALSRSVGENHLTMQHHKNQNLGFRASCIKLGAAEGQPTRLPAIPWTGHFPRVMAGIHAVAAVMAEECT